MVEILDKALKLHASPLFAGLDANALVSLAELAQTRTVRAGERLFAAGEETSEAFVIVRGRLSMVGPTVADVAPVPEEAGPGECVGELPALTGRPRALTATALEDTELLELAPDVLLDVLTDHPEVVRALATRLSARVRSSGNR